MAFTELPIGLVVCTDKNDVFIAISTEQDHCTGQKGNKVGLIIHVFMSPGLLYWVLQSYLFYVGKVHTP